ncbi:hypothetical protein BUALT_Bualt04G0099900 [Buddleja alternifolia]|uniref:Mitochondrial protein n=1 Tax=Buddleja alternifolia TaxID=168488 RepID=A0AAV6XMQ6_9LAMI|nr:hypothetical protein BUALT_Bualt04G0099900 [Buddleja alternifolia]
MFQFAKFEKSKERRLATELGYGFPIGDPWITGGISPWPFASKSVLPSQCPDIHPMHSFRSPLASHRLHKLRKPESKSYGKGIGWDDSIYGPKCHSISKWGGTAMPKPFEKVSQFLIHVHRLRANNCPWLPQMSLQMIFSSRDQISQCHILIRDRSLRAQLKAYHADEKRSVHNVHSLGRHFPSKRNQTGLVKVERRRSCYMVHSIKSIAGVSQRRRSSSYRIGIGTKISNRIGTGINILKMLFIKPSKAYFVSTEERGSGKPSQMTNKICSEEFITNDEARRGISPEEGEEGTLSSSKLLSPYEEEFWKDNNLYRWSDLC